MLVAVVIRGHSNTHTHCNAGTLLNLVWMMKKVVSAETLVPLTLTAAGGPAIASH